MVKNPPANAGDIRDVGSILGSGRSPWRRAWQPSQVFLPGESHGQRSLADYSPWGGKESATTEQLSIYTVRRLGHWHAEKEDSLWGHREKAAVCKPRREASEETNPAHILILDFPASRK